MHRCAGLVMRGQKRVETRVNALMTPASINFPKNFLRRRWTRGSSPRVTQRSRAGGSNPDIDPTVSNWSRRTFSASLGLLSGGLEDQPRDFFGVRDQREMAGLHFDGRCAHALGHEALQVWIDCAVFSRNGIITRLGSPCCVRGLAGEQGLVERLLDSIEHFRLRLRQVAREVAQERFLAETSFIAVENDASRRLRSWKHPRPATAIPRPTSRPCRHIHK